MSINKKNQGPITISRSDEYLLNRANSPPQISALTAQSVSQYRKEALTNDLANGLYKEGNGPQFNQDGMTSLGNVVASGSIRKNAQVLTNGGSNSTGFGDAVYQSPEIYSPLWLNSNLSLPRDRATINAWLRAFFALNPFVHNAIQLHSTYPLSKLSIKCPDPDIKKFFDDMIEELDLMNICVQIAQEFWLLGEAFILTELDRSKTKWGRIMIQNPDFMIVNRTAVDSEPTIMLRPDQNLKRIVSSNKPSDIEQRKQIDPYIIDAVKRGQNIVLNNFNVTHLARKISPYEIRGTGLPVCIFRQLMLFDRLRESKFVQADEMINPWTLIKIGTDGAEGQHPGFNDLEAWREVFEAAANNKNFKIFTHPGVAIEKIATTPYDISGDITQLIKEIYIGLQVPQVLMDGGADTTYANGGVALDVLRQRYMQLRNMFSIFLKRKIFAPISKINKFYTTVKGKKQLIVPDIDWNHMSLFDAGDYITNMITLTQPSGGGAEGGAASPRASTHALYRSIGLDWDEEQRKIRKEAIQAEIHNKEAQALKTLSLNELRALDPDEEIPEPTDVKEQPVPGEQPGVAGGAPELGGLPGLDMGAPPPPPSPSPPSAPAPPAPGGAK